MSKYLKDIEIVKFSAGEKYKISLKKFYKMMTGTITTSIYCLTIHLQIAKSGGKIKSLQ